MVTRDTGVHKWRYLTANIVVHATIFASAGIWPSTKLLMDQPYRLNFISDHKLRSLLLIFKIESAKEPSIAKLMRLLISKKRDA
jgi:hypothetical protein